MRELVSHRGREQLRRRRVVGEGVAACCGGGAELLLPCVAVGPAVVAVVNEAWGSPTKGTACWGRCSHRGQGKRSADIRLGLRGRQQRPVVLAGCGVAWRGPRRRRSSSAWLPRRPRPRPPSRRTAAAAAAAAAAALSGVAPRAAAAAAASAAIIEARSSFFVGLLPERDFGGEGEQSCTGAAAAAAGLRSWKEAKQDLPPALLCFGAEGAVRCCCSVFAAAAAASTAKRHRPQQQPRRRQRSRRRQRRKPKGGASPSASRGASSCSPTPGAGAEGRCAVSRRLVVRRRFVAKPRPRARARGPRALASCSRRRRPQERHK